MITYDPLWETMKKKSISKYYLIHYCQVSSGQLSRMKKNRHVSTHTINMLCTLLSCQVADIMEYQPDFLPPAPLPPMIRPRKKKQPEGAGAAADPQDT